MITFHLPGLDAAALWRRLCEVDPRIVVSGDLSLDPEAARRQLDEWIAAGITDIVDVRVESNDADLVADFAPGLRYHWAPTHDDGTGQPDAWFDRTVDRVLEILDADPEAKVLIHCHMGVNRAPSMAMAVLMSLGYSAVGALDAIRSARPIAGIIYSAHVLDWFHRRNGTPVEVAAADELAVRAWHDEHPLDVAAVIQAIRFAEAFEVVGIGLDVEVNGRTAVPRTVVVPEA